MGANIQFWNIRGIKWVKMDFRVSKFKMGESWGSKVQLRFFFFFLIYPPKYVNTPYSSFRIYTVYFSTFSSSRFLLLLGPYSFSSETREKEKP